MVRIWSAGDQLPKLISWFTKVQDMGEHTLQDVQADAPQTVDVWVVDLGEKADLGWGHGVVVWEEEFKLENAAYQACQQRSEDFHV